MYSCAGLARIYMRFIDICWARAVCENGVSLRFEGTLLWVQVYLPIRTWMHSAHITSYAHICTLHRLSQIYVVMGICSTILVLNSNRGKKVAGEWGSRITESSERKWKTFCFCLFPFSFPQIQPYIRSFFSTSNTISIEGSLAKSIIFYVMECTMSLFIVSRYALNRMVFAKNIVKCYSSIVDIVMVLPLLPLQMEDRHSQISFYSDFKYI